MWYFEAKYYDMIDKKAITRKIEFDGERSFNSEKEC